MKKPKKSPLRVGKETFGSRDITEAFTEALAPYFSSKTEVEVVNTNSK